MSEQALSISRAAEACGITAKNIRYYEEIGLIPKAPRHNNAARTGGNRLYREDDLRRLRFIRNSRLLGLSLNDIAVLLAMSKSKGCPGAQSGYRSRLESHLATVDERIEQLRALKATLEALLATADRSGLVGRCGCTEPSVQAVPVNRLFGLSVESEGVTGRRRIGRAA